jgi:hypothetical protein
MHAAVRCALLASLLACGARTGLEKDHLDAGSTDTASDAPTDAPTPDAPDAVLESTRPALCDGALPSDSLVLVVRGALWSAPLLEAGLVEACGGTTLVVAEAHERVGDAVLPVFPYFSLGVRASPESEGTVAVTGQLIDRFEAVDVEGTFEISELGHPHDDARGRALDEDGWCVCNPVEAPEGACDDRSAESYLVGDIRLRGPGIDLAFHVNARQCHHLHAICI